MAIIITLVILVGIAIALILIIKHALFISNLKWHFQHNNTITFGPKSSGKDLVTNYFVNKINEPYYSNLPYTKDCKWWNPLVIKDLSIEPNTPMNFIDGKIEKVPHKFIESTNAYISDMGVYMPNYLDNVLYKKYPSLPLYYPLSSQLYDMNIHFNSQDLNRGWKALREQADYFIWTKKTTRFLGYLITKVVCYEKYSSAEQKLLPIKTRFLNKYSKAEVDVYNATHGEIKTGHVIQRIKNVHYDTRYFEKMILDGDRIPNPKKKRSRR